MLEVQDQCCHGCFTYVDLPLFSSILISHEGGSGQLLG
jgi:hypothetical protein